MSSFLRKIGIDKIPLRFTGLGSGRSNITRSQYFRYLAQTVYITPLLLGLASAYLFAFVPQMQEVYLGLIEDADYARGLAGLAAVSLFSACLYAWNQIEVTRRIDAIYPDHADIHFDRRVFDVRDLKTAFAASLPFFGLLLGLLHVYRHVLDAGAAGLPEDSLKALPGLPPAVAGAGIITFAACALTFALFLWLRKKAKTQKRLIVFCYALTLFLLAAPFFVPDAILIASRFAGPLMSTALVLIEVAVAIRVLMWLLQRMFRLLLAVPSWILMVTDGLPLAIRQAAVLLLPLLVVGGIAVPAIFGESDRVEPEQEASAKAGADIAPVFRQWLAQRKTGPGRYPVFIVAAQGGGIYAASTTGAFLAALQDNCPAFARHVFAISAVSGGSVGASLFNAVFADSIARGTNRKASVDVEPGCDSLFSKPGELSKRLRAITQDDHISPVLANLLPDFAGGFMPGTLRSGTPSGRKSACESSNPRLAGRDRVLEKSFIYSFRLSGPSGPGTDYVVCSEKRDISLLTSPFSEGWSETRDVPALLLNATWVETGYRVAFSPFSLQAFGGGTLYAFSNLDTNTPNPRLIEAAVISARFPFLMPPWTFKLDGNSHLTFVDGGYADSSAVSTAHQLYNKLKEAGGDDIDLYLIALTDKSKALTAAGVTPVPSMPVRSWLYDVLSPVTAVLSVRDLQSRKAVTEARTQLGQKMIVVQLDQKTFPLPLGWKLSGLSSDIIRLTIGDPANCTADDRSDTAISIATRNSCELKRIAGLLAPPKTLTSQMLFPHPSQVPPSPQFSQTALPAQPPQAAIQPPPKAVMPQPSQAAVQQPSRTAVPQTAPAKTFGGWEISPQ